MIITVAATCFFFFFFAFFFSESRDAELLWIQRPEQRGRKWVLLWLIRLPQFESWVWVWYFWVLTRLINRLGFGWHLQFILLAWPEINSLCWFASPTWPQPVDQGLTTFSSGLDQVEFFHPNNKWVSFTFNQNYTMFATNHEKSNGPLWLASKGLLGLPPHNRNKIKNHCRCFWVTWVSNIVLQLGKDLTFPLPGYLVNHRHN